MKISFGLCLASRSTHSLPRPAFPVTMSASLTHPKMIEEHTACDQDDLARQISDLCVGVEGTRDSKAEHVARLATFEMRIRSIAFQ